MRKMVLFSLLSDICSRLLPNPRKAELRSYNPALWQEIIRECKVLQSSKQQNVLLGDAIRFFLNPADGGFSYEQIPISCEELMLKFDQMDPAVLYSRRLRITNSDLKNDQLSSLMLPMLIKEENGSWMRYR